MPEGAYLAELVRRARAVLGPWLTGVYAGGSLALGGYEPPRSDLDVAVVVGRPLAREEKDALVAALRHEALPCPARGLELVVYTAAAARTPDAEAAFELNLNTGRGMEFRADLQPVPGELHWFALDRAILHAHGITLTGPPAAETFPDPGPAVLLPVLAESLRWCLAHELGAEAVLTACRAVRYAEEAVWSSKRAAGEWARGRLGDDELVATALQARGSGAPLAGERVRSLLEAALVRLDAAAPPRRA